MSFSPYFLIAVQIYEIEVAKVEVWLQFIKPSYSIQIKHKTSAVLFVFMHIYIFLINFEYNLTMRTLIRKKQNTNRLGCRFLKPIVRMWERACRWSAIRRGLQNTNRKFMVPFHYLSNLLSQKLIYFPWIKIANTIVK